MYREMKRVLKIIILFFALFLVNTLVLITLSKIEFDIQATELSYLFPPLFSTVVLLIIDKMKRNKSNN